MVAFYFRIDSLAAGRDHIYDATWAAIPHVWVTGAGPGAAKFFMFQYYPYLINSPEYLYWEYYSIKSEFGHAHNFYLFCLTDLGLLGFVFSILLPIVFFIFGNRCIKYYKNVNLRDYFISVGLTSMGITYFFRGFFEYAGIISYGYLSIDLPFWIIFSLIIYYYNKMRNEIKYND